MDRFDGAIISIGALTDKILRKFNLPDNVIPRLRVLTQKHKSSDWQFILRGTEWGFTYEQAVNIAEAMKHDITGEGGFKIVRVSSWHHLPISCTLANYPLLSGGRAIIPNTPPLQLCYHSFSSCSLRLLITYPLPE